MEIQTYREKLTSKEECLSSQKVEIDLLKSSKEELNNSLKATTEILEELKKTKVCKLIITSSLRMAYTCNSGFSGMKLSVFILIFMKKFL